MYYHWYTLCWPLKPRKNACSHLTRCFLPLLFPPFLFWLSCQPPDVHSYFPSFVWLSLFSISHLTRCFPPFLFFPFLVWLSLFSIICLFIVIFHHLFGYFLVAFIYHHFSTLWRLLKPSKNTNWQATEAAPFPAFLFFFVAFICTLCVYFVSTFKATKDCMHYKCMQPHDKVLSPPRFPLPFFGYLYLSSFLHLVSTFQATKECVARIL